MKIDGKRYYVLVNINTFSVNLIKFQTNITDFDCAFNTSEFKDFFSEGGISTAQNIQRNNGKSL